MLRAACAFAFVALIASGCTVLFDPGGSPLSDAASNSDGAGPDAVSGPDAAVTQTPFACDNDTIALYHFDGLLEADCANLNLTGPMTFENGVVGANAFSGMPAFRSNFPLTPTATLDFWFRPLAIDPDSVIVSFHGELDSQGSRVARIVFESNGVSLHVFDADCIDSSATRAFVSFPLRTDRFYHVTAVIDRVSRLSVLGVGDEEISTTSRCDPPGTTHLWVNGLEADVPPVAAIDELRISSTQRTAHDFPP